MSLFAQLYLAGLATLSLPILFHFLRRSPRGVMPFSSLMFLSPSPPRLTRRSRIDHWLLLLLRATALALLALAFCRPYFREDSRLGQQFTPGRKVALLVDASASMRRAGLWQQAERAVGEALQQLNPQDAVALYSFDDRLHVVNGFDTLGQSQSLQVEAVRKAFKTIEPSWGRTDLGDALATLATRLEAAEDREGDEQPLQIIVISDMQTGADLSSLQAIAWPERVSVDVRAVATDSINASVHVLERSLEETDSLAARLRVINNHAAALPVELKWGTSDGFTDGGSSSPTRDETSETRLSGNQSFQAPAAGSKVVQVRRADELSRADRVMVEGDEEPFDNICYLVPPTRREVRIHFWGDEAKEDATGLRLYLENAAATAPHHQLNVTASDKDAAMPEVQTLTNYDLVVITRSLSPEESARARAAVMAGARVLLVIREVDAAVALNALLPPKVRAELAEVDSQYTLLTHIDFNHPIFAPLASARYSDFTKVQFWRHRRVKWSGDFQDLRTLAKFDDGDLAIGQWPLGEGEVTLFTSGWQPRDSRLALSSKFVPLAAGLLDDSQTDRSALQFEVNEAVPRELFREISNAMDVKVAKPNGDVVAWNAGDFEQADLPGIYRISYEQTTPEQTPDGQVAEDGADEAAVDGEADPDGTDQERLADLVFAVNLSPQESRTESFDPKELANNGVRMGQAVALGQLERKRQRLSRELENRQKLWQWLISACLIVLIVETLLAARRST